MISHACQNDGQGLPAFLMESWLMNPAVLVNLPKIIKGLSSRIRVVIIVINPDQVVE